MGPHKEGIRGGEVGEDVGEVVEGGLVGGSGGGDGGVWSRGSKPIFFGGGNKEKK